MAKSEKRLTRSEKLLNRAKMLLNKSEAERKQRCPLMQEACATEAIATLLLMLAERDMREMEVEE